MKKLSKLKLESLNQSQFESLTAKEMTRLNGGTTYGNFNTMTGGGKSKTVKYDGKDSVD